MGVGHTLYIVLITFDVKGGGIFPAALLCSAGEEQAKADHTWSKFLSSFLPAEPL